MWKKKVLNSLPYILIPLIIILVFGKTIFFDFIRFDDDALILRGYPFIRNLQNIPNAFIQDANISSGSYSNYYRPVQLITLIINAQFCNQNAGCYHIANLIFHSIFSVLAYLLLRRLKIDKWIALFLTILFSVHPALVSIIGWIPGGMEAVFGIFFISSLLFFDAWLREKKPKHLFFYILFFNLALYTKETALLLVPTTVLYGQFIKRQSETFKNKTLYIIWTVSVAIWVFLRSNATKNFHISIFDQISLNNLVGYLFYLGKIFPVNLSVMPIARDTSVIPGIITLIALLLLLIHAKPNKLFMFGYLWFLLLLLPAITQPKVLHDPLFLEHRLYLPMVGVLISLGAIITEKIKFRQNTLILLGVFLIMLSAFASGNRVGFYKNALIFWNQAIVNSPSHAVSYVSLGEVYHFQNNLDKAEELYKKSITLYPHTVFVHTNLGLIYFERGDSVSANREILEDLKYNNNDYSWLQLGRIFYSEKMYDKALESWTYAYNINPYNLPVVINLALVNSDLKNFKEAKKYYDLAVSLGGYDSPDKEWLEKIKFLEN